MDTIADMLARIRNAQRAGHDSVIIPYSKFKKGVLQVMLDAGYIKTYEAIKGEGPCTNLVVQLKYLRNRVPVIKEINRVSKPGCRIYSAIEDLRGYYNNFGTVILSTSRGVMSDVQARSMNVGGEVVCKIF